MAVLGSSLASGLLAPATARPTSPSTAAAALAWPTDEAKGDPERAVPSADATTESCCCAAAVPSALMVMVACSVPWP